MASYGLLDSCKLGGGALIASTFGKKKTEKKITNPNLFWPHKLVLGQRRSFLLLFFFVDFS